MRLSAIKMGQICDANGSHVPRYRRSSIGKKFPMLSVQIMKNFTV